MKEVFEKPIFGNVLKAIRMNRSMTIRDFATLLGFTAPYVGDLEKNNRKPSENVVELILEKFSLSKEEKYMLIKGYLHDQLIVPNELLYYLINNDLIDSIRVIKENDVDGSKLKEFADSFKKKNIR